ncbi:MAG: TolC family protein [Acidobacteria bacterium]|nr:TolC family protein [Acidobacteriota bacterium]
MRTPCVIFLVLALASTTLAADGPVAQPVTLTLQEAVARALVYSHRVAEQNARIAGAEASVLGREAASRPLVSVSAGYTRTNHVDEFGVPTSGGAFRTIYPDIPDNYHSRLDVQWPLYTSGRVESLTRSARLELQAVQNDRETTRSDVRLDVTRAYWTLVTARANLRVVDESVRRMDAHLADVREQLRVGLLPPSDVLTVEAQTSRQRLQAIEAKAAEDVATADLRRLLGLEPGTTLTLDAPLDVLVEPAPDLSTLKDEARRSRPELKALAVRVESARAREQAAMAQNRPMLGVLGGVDYANPNPRIFPRQDVWRTSWDVSVSVGWTLWNGGRTKAEVAEADAAARAPQARLQELDRALVFEVEQRALELDAARAAIMTANEAVRAATEARGVLGGRFGAGVATSTDVLDAQVALLQAELDRTRALASAHLAQARLERALGR